MKNNKRKKQKRRKSHALTHSRGERISTHENTGAVAWLRALERVWLHGAVCSHYLLSSSRLLPKRYNSTTLKTPSVLCLWKKHNMNYTGGCCQRLSRLASPEHLYGEDPAALLRPQQKHQREEAEKDLEAFWMRRPRVDARYVFPEPTLEDELLHLLQGWDHRATEGNRGPATMFEEEERYPFASNPKDFIGAPTTSHKPSPLKGLKRRKAEWTKEVEETEEEEAAEGGRTRWESKWQRAPKRSKKMR
ncbi:hypothetical protein QOT17_016372 [Balamuthia mandrillaris]